MLARLSDLLRESLRDFSVHEVPLGSELEFLDTYLEIQSARLGSRLKVQKKIAPDALDVLVPRMLLQPIVENATRHGMPDGDSPLTVQVEATVVEDSLLLCVADDGAGLDGSELEEGVGLRNTRERLMQLYGDAFAMTAGERPTGGFEVRIRMPARADADGYNEIGDRREIA
jgi:sensor histidine kinase YesM